MILLIGVDRTEAQEERILRVHRNPTLFWGDPYPGHWLEAVLVFEYLQQRHALFPLSEVGDVPLGSPRVLITPTCNRQTIISYLYVFVWLFDPLCPSSKRLHTRRPLSTPLRRLVGLGMVCVYQGGKNWSNKDHSSWTALLIQGPCLLVIGTAFL